MIVEGHPAVRVVDEKIAEAGRRKAGLAAKIQDEQRRYDCKNRLHLGAPLDHPRPTPPADLSEAFRNTMPEGAGASRRAARRYPATRRRHHPRPPPGAHAILAGSPSTPSRSSPRPGS